MLTLHACTIHTGLQHGGVSACAALPAAFGAEVICTLRHRRPHPWHASAPCLISAAVFICGINAADIQPGQGLYYSTLTQSWRARNCDSNNYGVTNRTYGLTPSACRCGAMHSVIDYRGKGTGEDRSCWLIAGVGNAHQLWPKQRGTLCCLVVACVRIYTRRGCGQLMMTAAAAASSMFVQP